jgi:hypothetical protein
VKILLLFQQKIVAESRLEASDGDVAVCFLKLFNDITRSHKAKKKKFFGASCS